MNKRFVPRTDTEIVGKALAHDSARGHVSGRARYIDDMLEPEGTLHLAPGLSPVAAGRLKSMDLSAVESAPGVVAVLTAKDIPGPNECSPSFGGDPILAEKEILFHGQVLFAVVAETRKQARKAARLAKVEITEKKPLVSVQQGLKSGKTVLDPYTFAKGDPSAAIGKAKRSLSGRIVIGGQEHFYLEGMISMAVPGEAGAMKVFVSTQHPTEVQHLVAKAIGKPDAKVTAECRRMGGGFGGKESQAGQWACLAAIAAQKLNRPCKFRLDRDDDMVATGKRHDFDTGYSVGFDADGVVKALDVSMAARCGYSADLSLGVVDRAMFHADNAYYYPEYRIHTDRVFTNTVSNTAFRGFGGPQGLLFAERMMDHIAIELGEDPLEVRKRNFYRRGKAVTPYGMPVKDILLEEITAGLEKSARYQARRKEIAKFNAGSRFLKRGISLTPLKFGIAFTLKHLNQAGALVHVYTDGSIQVNHGGTEMGQGLYMKVAQVVAEVFGQDISRVEITATTTDKVPNTTPTAASSGSDLNGMAAKNAAEKIRDRMAKVAAKLYQGKANDVRFSNGMVHVGGREVPFAEVAKQCFLERVQLSDTGFFSTPNITWDRETQTGNPFLYFAYGAACSEVIIDTLTGEMKVTQVDILHDVGASLNPAIDIGQIEGGFVQGMGWLTTEELVFDDKGRLRTHAPSTYKIPACSDVPEAFKVKLYDYPGKKPPTVYHSKAVGEPPLMLAVSVFSAITHAIASINPGRLPDLDAPATPEAILRAVDSMRN
ncbi:MAG: xanthine dehydrogenase molybdopterin binding subunit [Nitratireductor sp.]|nr:xanthine dehydrogenase molybdopterin binding subunit [Nitratireductor sp.]